MRARADCAHTSIRDHWVKCMSRCPDQVVNLKRDAQCLSPQASLILIDRPTAVGRKGEAGGRKRPNEDETRVRHEGENGRAQEGGLTAPKRVRGAPKTQWEGKCCFFFAARMKKKGVCKGNLQTTQQV
ncbi:hypothetical protein TNCV_1085721 [Trichonephila clavipes]|nr:hypothetical protein TNCV_1085721 [Trichonephila clavipes]